MIVNKCFLKKKIIILLFFSVAIVFILVLIYQMKILEQLGYNTLLKSPTSTLNNQNTINRVDEGSELYETKTYKFVCIKSLEEIDLDHFNDNYCDCSDGSDEPGTNACANSVFFCRNQYSHLHRSIPSSRVNDGVCDCCDGSDEYDVKVNILDTRGHCLNRC